MPYQWLVYIYFQVTTMHKVTPLMLGAALMAASTQAKVPDNFDKNLLAQSVKKATVEGRKKIQATESLKPGYALSSYQGFPSVG